MARALTRYGCRAATCPTTRSTMGSPGSPPSFTPTLDRVGGGREPPAQVHRRLIECVAARVKIAGHTEESMGHARIPGGGDIRTLGGHPATIGFGLIPQRI